MRAMLKLAFVIFRINVTKVF
ncbi:hypothetical protein DFAR_290002 [Desulfarculales bacterium]